MKLLIRSMGNNVVDTTFSQVLLDSLTDNELEDLLVLNKEGENYESCIAIIDTLDKRLDTKIGKSIKQIEKVNV